LTTIKKYKQLIAIFLMALYVIVATPVQFWHHHDNAGSVQSAKSDKKEASSFSKDKGAFEETKCQVCSHQFATYCNGVTEIFEAPLFAIAPKWGLYYSHVPSIPLFNFSNKGPPAIA
jgi:hypothetical protein